MARNHARILTKIWQDPDFRALTVDAQHAYFAVVSSPALSYVGVMDYIPQRIAGLALGHTERRAKAALELLDASRFLVVDKSTAEMCVRSLVRHDRILERINMGKATARAFGKVTSLCIRDTLINELGRVYATDRNMAGWTGFKEIDPDAMADVIDAASRMSGGM